MTIVTPIACIAIALILCINVSFITGVFGKVGSKKASHKAAGLVFTIVVMGVGLILLFD